MPASPSTQDRNIAATFAKGLAVLEAFDGSAASLSLADLARITGQDRAATRRGALTLMQLGYLRQDGRQFSLTPKVLALAGGFLQANQFGRQVQPVLNHHAAALGGEITLAMRDGDHVLLVAQSTVHGGPVSYGFTLGSRLPLAHTSLGRMLLACEPREVAADLLARLPLPRHTGHSLTDPAQILERIDIARADGFIITDSEFEPGITGIAVAASRPGAPGVVVGSSAPRGRGGSEGAAGLDHILRSLQNCASELRRTGAVDGL